MVILSIIDGIIGKENTHRKVTTGHPTPIHPMFTTKQENGTMLEQYHQRWSPYQPRRVHKGSPERRVAIPKKEEEEHRNNFLTFLKPGMGMMYYSELLLRSLILYAEKNATFEFMFRVLLREKLPQREKMEFLSPELTHHAELFDVEGEALILEPKDTPSAIRRARWLLARLDEECLPGSTRTRTILIEWTEQQHRAPNENPKQIVVGIIVVAIPGITMGKFHLKKKMSLIIRSDLVRSPTLELQEECIRASFDVFQRAVLLARGNMKKLEPEIADWFFNKREFVFHEGTSAQLREIRALLVRLGIPHSASEKDGMISVLAISPVLDSDRISSEFGTQQLNI